MAIDMSQFQEVFFDEATEYLATAEALLLYLEPGSLEADQLEDIYRAIHSIKGSSATFGLTAMAGLAQQMQALLDRVRTGAMPVSEEGLAALLDACRMLRGLLAAGREGSRADEEGAALAGVRLARLAAGEPAVPEIHEPVREAPEAVPAPQMDEVPDRDFAAMAGELHDLAQRTAVAAQEIVSLARSTPADEGGDLAREAEESIRELMGSFGRLERVVVGAAASAGGPDLRDLSLAVGRLGEAVRQTEARARHGLQTAQVLREQFEALMQAVARIALPGGAGGSGRARLAAGRPGPRPRAPLPKFRRPAPGTGGADDWPEF